MGPSGSSLKKMKSTVLWVFLCFSSAIEHFGMKYPPQEKDEGRQFSCPARCSLCSRWKVICSGVDLREVPRNISPDTRILIIDNNPLKRLRRESFQQLPNLTTINVVNCSIKFLQDATFYRQSKSLRTLIMSRNNLEYSSAEFLATLTNLRHLDMSETQRQRFHQVFRKLVNLMTLNLAGNFLQHFPQWHFIPTSLTTLDISHNQLTYLTKKSATTPKKKTNIEVLIARENKIRELYRNGLLNFPKLTYLDLSGNELLQTSSSSFQSDSLEIIKLADTKFYIQEENWNVFQDIPNIREIKLSNCRIDDSNYTQRSFQNLRRLKKLDLSGSRIRPTKQTFKDLESLEELRLSRNSLSLMKSEVFESVANSLRVLMLSSCQLSTIQFESFPLKMWKNLRTVDFSENPFICDCNFVWLRRWLNRASNSNVTILEWKNYWCQSPNGPISMSKMTKETDEKCFQDPLPNDPWLIVTFILTLSIVLLSLGGSFANRFQWHLRYWYFVYMIKPRKGLADSLRNKEEGGTYTYDAFVGYSRHDAGWVIDHLLPRLELENNLRLCIHERDWLPGQSILESIDLSRKTLLIVSNAFALSPWCHFELTSAQMRLLKEDRDSLILVLLEEIADCNMTPRLHLQMQRTTVVEWTDKDIGRQLFWENVTHALVTPSQSVMNGSLSVDTFV